MKKGETKEGDFVIWSFPAPEPTATPAAPPPVPAEGEEKPPEGEEEKPADGEEVAGAAFAIRSSDCDSNGCVTDRHTFAELAVTISSWAGRGCCCS
jgi:hypothetical protein